MKYEDLSTSEKQRELLERAASAEGRAAFMKDPEVRETMWSLAKLYRQLAEDVGNLTELRARAALENPYPDVSQR